jgi:hypothetical protein
MWRIDFFMADMIIDSLEICKASNVHLKSQIVSLKKEILDLKSVIEDLESVIGEGRG